MVAQLLLLTRNYHTASELPLYRDAQEPRRWIAQLKTFYIA